MYRNLWVESLKTEKETSKSEDSKPNGSSAVSDNDNWAARLRPRDRSMSPYFHNEQARQIERNLGI